MPDVLILMRVRPVEVETFPDNIAGSVEVVKSACDLWLIQRVRFHLNIFLFFFNQYEAYDSRDYLIRYLDTVAFPCSRRFSIFTLPPFDRFIESNRVDILY